jgi:hypothetical protein
MRYLLFSGLIFLTGCCCLDTILERVHKPPIIIEAQIIELPGCDKYCWYKVKITKVIRNTIKIKLDSDIEVLRENYKSRLELNKSYILELDYYNEAFWISSLKEK